MFKDRSFSGGRASGKPTVIMDTYRKVLTAKFSPKNGCNVPEGEVLTVRPRKRLPSKEDKGHYFVGTRHRSKRARFGWVREVDPFTLEDFFRQYLENREVTPQEQEHLTTMLTLISHLEPGTPVTATYFVRGVIEKKTVFTIHKVFFYPATPDKNSGEKW
jgi:hypothetical protein